MSGTRAIVDEIPFFRDGVATQCLNLELSSKKLLSSLKRLRVVNGDNVLIVGVLF